MNVRLQKVGWSSGRTTDYEVQTRARGIVLGTISGEQPRPSDDGRSGLPTRGWTAWIGDAQLTSPARWHPTRTEAVAAVIAAAQVEVAAAVAS